MKRIQETIGRLAAGSLRWAALAVAIGLAGSALAEVTKKAEWVGDFPVSNGSVVTDTKGDITLSTYDVVNVSTARGITLNGKSITLTPKTALSGGVTVVMGYKGVTSSTAGTLINLSKTAGDYGTAISANLKRNYGFSLGWGTNYTWGDSNSATISATQPNDGDIHYVTLSYAGNTSTGTIFRFDGANKVQKMGLGSSSFGTVAEITLGGLRSANALSGVEIVYIAVYSGVVTDDEATSTCNAGKTAFAEGSMNPTVDDSNNATFTVTDDAYYCVLSGATYNSITFNVADGKTLELFGAAALTGSNGITVNGGNVKVAVAGQLNGALAGNGTIVYKGAVPSNVTYSSSWIGTVWIKELQGNDARNFDSYGQGDSKVKISGITGYLNSNPRITFSRELVLDDDVYGFALKLGNGNSPEDSGDNANRYATFKKLSGDGTLTAGSTTGGNGAYSWSIVKIVDSSEFTGTVNCQIESGACLGGVIFCSSEDEEMPGTMSEMFKNNKQRIYISAGRSAANGNVVTIPAGKTWVAAGGIVNAGALVVDGSVSTTITNTGTAEVFGSVVGTIANSGKGTVTVKEGGKVRLPYTAVETAFTTLEEGSMLYLTGEEGVASVGTMPVTFNAGVEATNPSVTIVRRDGGYCVGTWNGTDAYTYNGVIDTSIVGGASGADLDFTFTNTYARAYGADTKPGAVTLNVSEGTVAYNNTFGDKTTAMYGYAVPYTQNGNLSAWLSDNSAAMTLVVVATMPATPNSVFFHMGRDTTDNNDARPGLLFSTGAAENEVVISYNLGNVVYPVTTMQVPNAASARHVYAVTKEDKDSKSVITVYLDGTKWKQLSVDAFTFAGNCGVQIGSTFGGQIVASAVDKQKYQKLSTVGDKASSVNAIRLFGSVLDETTIAKFSAPEEYPYASPYGSSARTFTDDGSWVESSSTPWSDTSAGGVASLSGLPLDGSSLTVTADNASGVTVSVNLDEDKTYEALTLTGDPIAFEFAESKTGKIKATGAITIGAETTIKAGALEVGGATTILDNGKAKLIFDYSDYDASGVTVANPQTTPLVLASMDEQAEGMVTCTLPTTPHRAYSFGYANGGYNLSIVAKQVTFYRPSVSVTTDLDTLAGAMESALSGDIITLNEDVTIPALSIPAGVEVALDGKALTATTLTVNGTITGTPTLANGATVSVSAPLVATAIGEYTCAEGTVVDASYKVEGKVKFIPLTSAVASVTLDNVTAHYSTLAGAVEALGSSTGTLTLLANTDTAFTLSPGQTLNVGSFTTGGVSIADGANGYELKLENFVYTLVDNRTSIWSPAGADTNWSTAGNWSTGYIPTQYTVVTFNEGAVVTLDSAATVAGIVVDGDVSITAPNGGNSLNTSGNLTGEGTLTLSDVCLASAAAEGITVGEDVAVNFTNDSELARTGSNNGVTLKGAVTISGSFKVRDVTHTLNGDVTINSGVSFTYGALFVINGDATVKGSFSRAGGSSCIKFFGKVTIEAGNLSIDGWKDGNLDNNATVVLAGAGATLTDSRGTKIDVSKVSTTVADSYVKQVGNVYSVETYKTVTFLDDDGKTVLQTASTYKVGDTVTAPADPTKDATAQYTYTFAGWTPAVAETVTGDATYTATYDSTVNQYTLTVPTVANATATVTVSGQSTDVRTFDYNTVVTVTYTPDTYYSITAGDGVQEFTMTENKSAVAPTVTRNTVTVTLPIVTGAYVTAATSDAGDVTPTGPNTLSAPAGSTLTLAWTASEGYILANTTTTVDVGAEAVTVSGDGLAQPAVIVAKIGDVCYASIAEAIADAANNQTVKVIVDNTITGPAIVISKDLTLDLNGKTVTRDGDGHVFEPVNCTFTITDTSDGAAGKVVSGSKIVLSGSPCTFTLEAGTLESDSVPVWIWGNGSASERVVNINGGKLVCGSTTTSDSCIMVSSGTIRMSAGVIESVCCGFEGTEVNVSGGNVTVGVDKVFRRSTDRATGGTFNRDVGDYCTTGYICVDNGNGTYSVVSGGVIKFVNDDGTTVLQTLKVPTGDTPAYTGETPTKAATAQYTYTFAGWDPEVTAVTGDATYTATYDSTVNKYTLTVPEVANATATVTVGEVEQTAPFTFDYGTVVTVTWTPAATYQITAGGTQEITLTENTTAAAPTVELDVVTFTVPSLANATVTAVTGATPTSNANEYTATIGAAVVVTYTANDGYVFAGGATTTTVNWTAAATAAPVAPASAPVVAVAKIGNTPYETLAAAIGAAQAGDTVTLLANVAEAVVINSTAKITLDGQNQYGIIPTSSTHSALKITASNADVELKNITVGDKTYTGRAVNIYNAANVKLVVTNSRLYSTIYTLNVYAEGAGSVDNVDITVTDTEIEGWAALNLWGDGGKVVVTGGKLTGNNKASYSPGNNEFGVIVLEGLSSGTTGATNYDIAVTGTELKTTSVANAQNKRNVQAVVLYNPHSDGNTVKLTNCTVERGEGDASDYPLIFEDTGSGENNTLLVKGVTDYGTSTDTALPEGYAYSAPDADGYRQVVEATYVAQIGSNGYPTLKAAFDDAADGDTITLVADVTDETLGAKGIVVNGNMTITLDLAGFNVTCTDGTGASNRMIKLVDTTTLNVINSSESQSVMSVLGSATPVANTSTPTTLPYGVFRAEVGTTLNINGGAAKNIKLVNGRAWGLNVKLLGATATLNGVVVESTYGGGIEVTEDELGGHTIIGQATLVDCEFTQTGYFDWCSTALSVSGGSSLTVESGTYTGEIALYVFSSGGVITVNGGTFIGRGNNNRNAFIAAVDTNTYPGYVGAMELKGGYFSGTFSITSPAYAVVTGGEYTVDPAAYCPTGYTSVLQEESGNYIVGPIGVAMIGNTSFQTLAEAFAAATDGCVIRLVADVTDETLGAKGIVVNGYKTITLDLAGFNVTCTDGTGASNRMIKLVGTTTLNVINSSESQSVMSVLGSATPVANTSTPTTLPYGVFRAEVGTTLNIDGGEAKNIKLVNGRAWGLNIKLLGATANINGVVVESTYGGGIEVTEDELGGHTIIGQATLVDCEFTQTGYFDWCSTALSVSGGSSLTVESGTYSGEYAIYVFSSGGVININGGTFEGLGNANRASFIAMVDTNTYSGYVGGMKFADGFFKGKFNITSPAYASVTGGYYTVNPADYCVAGYGAVETTEGSEERNAGYIYEVKPVEYGVEFNAGTGSPEDFVAPTVKFTIASADTILPSPTYTSNNSTFAGWVDSNNQVVKAIPAGTIGNISLTATWTAAKTVEITVKTAEQEPGEDPTVVSAPIKVTDAWVASNVTGGTGATSAKIQEELNKEDENGLKKWQNYVLGQAVNAAAQVVSTENSTETVAEIDLSFDVPSVDTGFDVTYRMDRVTEGGAEVEKGDEETSTPLVDLTQVETNAYFQVKAIITPKGDTTPEKAVEVEVQKVVGVMAVNSTMKNTIVAVPWESFAGDSITAGDLVYTGNRKKGDTLTVYVAATGRYKTWTLDADGGNWASVTTYSMNSAGDKTNEAAGDANDQSIPRGAGVWVYRKDVSEKIYLLGQKPVNPAAAAPLEAGSADKPKWNLVASPSVEEFNPNKAETPVDGATSGDQIVVPSDDATPIMYEFDASAPAGEKWGYNDLVVEEGKPFATPVRRTNVKVPAGTGFWYLNKSNKTNINLK